MVVGWGLEWQGWMIGLLSRKLDDRAGGLNGWLDESVVWMTCWILGLDGWIVSCLVS